MSKHQHDDLDDLTDDALFGDYSYERNHRKYDIRRGIEDYFDRKKLKEMDSWFDDDSLSDYQAGEPAKSEH